MGVSAVVVLVPVLGRPGYVEPFIDSLESSIRDVPCRPLFICSEGDDEQIAAVEARGVDFILSDAIPGGQYARKINQGYLETDEPWLFLAADDLCFCPRWADEAIAVSRPGLRVVGTNDLGNRRVVAGVHSTHTLVARSYIEERGGTADGSGSVLHPGYHHNFCNPPEAPIWMADCTFRPLGDVRVGDRVVGWERSVAARPAVGTPRRSLAYSNVTNIARRVAPLVRVVMESGRELRCTADHLWLNAAWAASGSKGGQEFVAPAVGRVLLQVADQPAPVPTELERVAGWLAGIYDGEGSGFYVATQSSLVEGNRGVLEEISRALVVLGIDHSRNVRKSGVVEFMLRGGRQAYLDFLLRIQPVKRKPLEALILGWRRRESSRRSREPIGGRRFGHRDRIVAVEPAGEGEVVSLTTTTGNYVAWGYASRNCDDEFIATAVGRGEFVHARGSWVEHLHPLWDKGDWDDTYARGQAGFEDDRRLFESRRRLWRTR